MLMMMKMMMKMMMMTTVMIMLMTLVMMPCMRQNHYVERSCRILVVNAPMIFSMVWSVVSPWINERTREKIKILGSDYSKTLLQVIK
jgi:membrane-anchored glycerophosphoryl diester phosphodiesterase (GDPDase)